ncbi:MAG: nucleoside-diphosphate kinase [Bacteroides sp.]|nr:nucleoside-diphosphate kinase [Bacteroides sp.]MCM1414158.1 nucleoside-diphosphate kinase [Bacteroides sp.]MCM1471292.1 nucleoside-diphosphate kinase [Bacteroides sp.]
MEQTLVIFKPSSIARGLVGQILDRFQRKGLAIAAMKMMKLDEKILREHYAHLVDRPFFPNILKSMTASPVIVMVLKGRDAVKVVRLLTGATNGREALPGTIRGDFSMSGQENIVHASSSLEDAEAEIKRFFNDDEIFNYPIFNSQFVYADDELK